MHFESVQTNKVGSVILANFLGEEVVIPGPPPPLDIQINTEVTTDDRTLLFNTNPLVKYGGFTIASSVRNISRVQFYVFDVIGSLTGKTYVSKIYQVVGGNIDPLNPLTTSTNSIDGDSIVGGEYNEFTFSGIETTGEIAIVIEDGELDLNNYFRLSGSTGSVDNDFHMKRYNESGVLSADLTDQIRAKIFNLV